MTHWSQRVCDPRQRVAVVLGSNWTTSLRLGASHALRQHARLGRCEPCTRKASKSWTVRAMHQDSTQDLDGASTHQESVQDLDGASHAPKKRPRLGRSHHTRKASKSWTVQATHQDSTQDLGGASHTPGKRPSLGRCKPCTKKASKSWTVECSASKAQSLGTNAQAK